MASRKRSRRLQVQRPGPALTANEKMFDALLRHQVGLQRVSKGIGRDVAKILNASERELRAAIHQRLSSLKSGIDTPASVNRLQRLLNEIKQIRGKSHDEVERLFQREMLKIAKAEPLFMAAATEVSLPVVVNTIIPDPALLRSIVTTRPFQGKTLKGWAKNIRAADIDRIETQIRLGLTQGETIPQISRRIVGSAKLKGADGVTAITRRNAEAIARTAVNDITNQAKQAFYKANSDIIKFEIYTATLDGVTTLICKSLDGKRFRVGEGDVPSLHMNCRSLRVPVFDDGLAGTRPMKPVTERGLLREFTAKEKLSGVTTRGALPHGTKGKFDDFARKRTRELIGQTPAKTTYQQFLKRQSKEFQSDTLGVTKAKLFRDGNLKLTKFVNRQGGELTLKQLAKTEAAAFRKAGLDPKKFL